MIAIKFPPMFEDRVSIYLKATNLKDFGITYDFKDTPGLENDTMCYWLFDYKHAKHVNLILKELIELRDIMGVTNLQFQYCYNEKEFYTQYSMNFGNIPWFRV